MGGQRHHRAEVYTMHRQFVTPSIIIGEKISQNHR